MINPRCKQNDVQSYLPTVKKGCRLKNSRNRLGVWTTTGLGSSKTGLSLVSITIKFSNLDKEKFRLAAELHQSNNITLYRRKEEPARKCNIFENNCYNQLNLNQH